MIWKDVDIVSELCVTCASANAMLPFFNPFLRGRVKIPCCLHCHSSGTAFDKNKEVYLLVRPGTVWAVFPREQEMKNEKKKLKKRKLWCVSLCVGTDTHLPTACPGGSSLPYVQRMVAKGYIVMSLQALYVLSQSHLEMFSWLPRIWGWSGGVKFSMLGVCFAIRKKKIIKFGGSWCYIFQDMPAPRGSFPQSKLFLIFKLRPCALAYQT